MAKIELRYQDGEQSHAVSISTTGSYSETEMVMRAWAAITDLLNHRGGN